MWRNRDVLDRQGMDFPGNGPVSHFHAALDLRGIRFGGYDNPDVPGSWDDLAEQVLRSHSYSVLLTHEVFGGSTRDEIARVGCAFAGLEIHVVCGARDLARQLPAVWQESLKNRRTRTFDAFVAHAMHVRSRQTEPHGFWRGQDTVAMLERWSKVADRSRIHVVTLPQRGSAPDELLRRFCQALSLEPGELDLEVVRSNASLNAEDAELLRRLNEELPDDLPWPAYERLVKRRFRRLAASRAGTGERLRVADSYAAVLGEYAAALQERLAASGYDIVGDLADLTPDPGSYQQGDARPGAIVSDAEVASLAREILRQAARDPHRPTARARTLMARFKKKRATHSREGRHG
jgi:hypothetical protein